MQHSFDFVEGSTALPMADEVQFVVINGARLAYKIAGHQHAPLLITLHGGRGQGTHHSDFAIYSQLSDKYRVLSFDYRGHGQSSRTKPYTFAQLVEDIEGVRKHFVRAEDEQVIICGGSFGGFLAQQYAITYPSHVSHLILRGTAPSHHRTFPLHEDRGSKLIDVQTRRVP